MFTFSLETAAGWRKIAHSAIARALNKIYWELRNEQQAIEAAKENGTHGIDTVESLESPQEGSMEEAEVTESDWKQWASIYYAINHRMQAIGITAENLPARTVNYKLPMSPQAMLEFQLRQTEFVAEEDDVQMLVEEGLTRHEAVAMLAQQHHRNNQNAEYKQPFAEQILETLKTFEGTIDYNDMDLDRELNALLDGEIPEVVGMYIDALVKDKAQLRLNTKFFMSQAGRIKRAIQEDEINRLNEDKPRLFATEEVQVSSSL